MRRTEGWREGEERVRRTALRLDGIAVRLARGRPAIDVALGEVFLALSSGNRLIDLGYSNKADFANEALGMPPRTFFALLTLAAGLRERPLLRQAVVAGEVTPVKARIVMSAATGEAEAGMVAAAMEMTAEELRELVGKGEAEAAGYRTLRWRMDAAQQDRLDAALSLAKEMVGYDAPEWRLTEAVARDWLESGEGGEEVGPSGTTDDPRWLEEMMRRGDEVSKQLQAVFEAVEVVAQAEGGAEALREENALALLARARRLLKRRERFDEPLGRVLWRIEKFGLWRWLGYRSLGEYCRERLGIAESTARQRVRLEERLRELPPLREALRLGRITYSKALVVARRATLLDVRDRIAVAVGTTWQQVMREARREEGLSDRRAKRRKVRGPRVALRVLSRAVESARQIFAARGEDVGDGEALARIADTFVARHEARLRRREWRRRWEKDVLMRNGGLCAVPGCTRAARHVHHIVFRRHGGRDEPGNCVGVCWPHHERGIHRGRLTVRGRGGEQLTWSFEDAEGVPFARWFTFGADDVRKEELASGDVSVA